MASNGPVASVALFTQRPTSAIRSIAVDSSSRTAVALLRVLCAQWFDVEPKFVKMHPDLPAMLQRCDAALLIGDRALFTEYETAGLDKVDLGEEWGSDDRVAVRVGILGGPTGYRADEPRRGAPGGPGRRCPGAGCDRGAVRTSERRG